MPHQDLNKLEPSDVSNLFKGRKPKGSPANTPNKNVVREAIAPAQPLHPAIEIDNEPMPEQGVGSQFIDQTQALPSNEEPIITEDQSQPILDPEQIIERYRTTLLQNGFKDDEDNLQQLVESNPDPNNISDFSAVEPQDNIEVKAPLDIIKRSLIETPVISAMLGLAKPLEIVGNAFSRYEAGKVGFLKKLGQGHPIEALQEGAKGITANAVTDFPEAKLRSSNLPEFGDFFRAKGVPEFLSALGGVGVDLLTDIPVFAGAGTLLKTIGKGSMKLGGEALAKFAGKEAVDKFMQLRASEMGRVVENAFKGKGRFDVGPEPVAFKTAQREALGEANSHVLDSQYVANRLSEVTSKNEKLGSTINNALKGNIDDLGKLDIPTQTFVKQGRNIIDKASTSLAAELEQMAAKDPEQFKHFTDRTGLGTNLGGQRLNPIEVMQAAKDNAGEYVKRAYLMYIDKNYKPSISAMKNAVQGLVDDGVVDNTKKAANVVRNILKDKKVNLKVKDQEVKIKQGSFIARKNIPSYLRELMGEVTDPSYNLVNTVRNVNEATAQMKVFSKMKELGMVSKTPTKEFTNRISQEGPLAWGAISGMYTSPEIHSMLTGINAYSNVVDNFFINTFQHIKGFKTVLNPKSHIHNVTGNLFMFGPLSGVSVFNKPQRFTESINIVKKVKDVLAGKLSKDIPEYKVYQEMVKHGVIGSELPKSEQIKFIENLINNPNPTKGTAFANFTKKLGKTAAEWYADEDIVPKMATYLDYVKKGMKPEEAVNELYKWFPNYHEASQLASIARNSGAGLFLGNPFMTFRTEAHRILLNAVKDPSRRIPLALMLSARAGFNAAVLAKMGLGAKDISEVFMSRPEALSDTIFNPLDPSGNFDINTRYVDPFNTRGLFAPLLAASGATGVNPIDYVLDFTSLSPEFGYSNLLTNALEPVLTGKGRFGEDLSFGDKVKQSLVAVGPTSFTSDIPKAVEALGEGDNPEAVRRAFRFFGIDLDKRNPDYIKGELRTRLKDKIVKGEDVAPTIRAITALGFNGQQMYQNVQKDVQKNTSGKGKKPIIKRNNSIDKVLGLLGEERTR